MQMQLNVSKGRDESRDRELAAAKKRLQEVLDGSRGLEAQTAELAVREAEQRKTAETLAKKLSEMEPELKRTQRALAEYERHSGVAAMMKAEQESIVHGLRRDLKTSMDVREQLLKRVAEFEPTRAQLELTATQLASAQEQVEVLQASLEEKAAIVKRMAAEAQTNLAQHAIRTAMLATCEEQLESLQAALDAKDAALRQVLPPLARVKTRCSLLVCRVRVACRSWRSTWRRWRRRRRNWSRSMWTSCLLRMHSWS